MKKILAMVAMTVILTSSTISASAENTAQETPTESNKPSLIDFIVLTKQAQSLLEQQVAEFKLAQLRAGKIKSKIESLEKYIGKTSYVFSGSTPQGWDCSGLVMWFYSDFGIELKHSVTAQIHSGEITDQAMPGDIVAFKHNGADMGYHNGIYIGDDLFIHSPREGKRTLVSSVSAYAKQHSEIVYTRINVGVLE
jgi:cell wall-associated NlpC family hydrolase